MIKNIHLIKTGVSHIAVLAIVNTLVASPVLSMMEGDNAEFQPESKRNQGIERTFNVPSEEKEKGKNSIKAERGIPLAIKQEKENPFEISTQHNDITSSHDGVGSQQKNFIKEDKEEGREKEADISLGYLPKLEDDKIEVHQAPINSPFLFMFGENDDTVKNIEKTTSLNVDFAQGALREEEGVEKDEVKAVALLQKAADQGDADAQYSLGARYAIGRGVEKDEIKAVKWYREAADQGHAHAQYSLGARYAEGRVVEKDDAKAVALYQKATDQGFAYAQYSLGLRYANGRGVEKDEAKAVALYQKAADQGDADAQYKLGIMYAQGRGVKKDEAKAVALYQKAADQGDADAQYSLGLRYAQGRGVKKDEVKAAELLQKAAEQGHSKAYDELTKIRMMYKKDYGSLIKRKEESSKLSDYAPLPEFFSVGKAPNVSPKKYQAREKEPKEAEIVTIDLKDLIELPNELKVHILSFLDTESLKNFRLANHELDGIAREAWPFFKARWSKFSHNPRELDIFKSVLQKIKIRTLSLVGFPPKEIAFEWIGANTSITALDLYESKEITDGCLYYLRHLNKLKKINLRGLQISDGGLRDLSPLSDLETLYIGSTNVTGEVFEYLEGSPKLKIIDLSKTLPNPSWGGRSNNTGMPLPTINKDLLNIAKFSNLEELDLSGNPVNDEGMQHIQILSKLKILNLSHTNIGDKGLNYMRNLTNLTSLYLTRTRVTGEGLLSMGTSSNFSKLKTLDLDHTIAGDFGLSFLDCFDGIKEVFLRNTKVRMEDILQYYQRIANIGNLGGYQIIIPIDTTDIPSLLAEIGNVKDLKNIRVKKIKNIDKNELKQYYQDRTGIKIITE